METVEIIASEYEWKCPKCDAWNTEVECPVRVKCSEYECGEEFLTASPKHVLG